MYIFPHLQEFLTIDRLEEVLAKNFLGAQQHYLASIGPRNLQLTGELADGWLPIWTHIKHLPDLKETIGKAAARAGRDISEITVAPQILCYATDDLDELAKAEQDVRGHIAYYIGGMGTYYYNLFCRYGYQRESDAIRAAWADRQRDKAATLITDEMVENIAILGNSAACRAKLEQFRSNGADMPVVAFPHGASTAAIERTLEALAPLKTPSQPVSHP